MQLDNSMIAAWSKCQRYYSIRYESNLDTTAPREALDVGSAIHEFASLYWSGEPTAPTIARWLEHLDSLEIPEERTQVARGKFLAGCARLAEHYPMQVSSNGTKLIYQRDAQDTLSPRWIVRYPEQAFSLPIGSNHEFIGKIDLIVEDDNRQLWIPELKTSGFAVQPTWRQYWRIASQPRGYVWAATKHFTLPIAGAIILPIFLTTRQAKGQKYGVASMTPEIELRYAPAQLEEWESETLDIIEFISTNPERLATGKYSGVCSSASYGRCSFFDYCATLRSPVMLTQSTEEQIWNPLV